jgi:predicted metalloprotease
MSFNDNARLDSARVRDRRGKGKGIAVGGGLGGGLILILSLIFGPEVVDGLGITDGADSTAGSGSSQAISECLDGADANERLDCRIVGTAESLDSFWQPALAAEGLTYTEPGVTLFTGQTSTGCGSATSAVGPFYCPADEQTYYDTAFFDELVAQYGASGGPLAQEYVVAHEFGHHIQNLTGVLGASARDPQGAESAAVRTELQADCYAGAWVAAASTTEDQDGVTFIEPVTDAQIADALNAASVIGDDRIQEMGSGQVNPETWTHGSSEQREKWFQTGMKNGATGCDTFSISGSEL